MRTSWFSLALAVCTAFVIPACSEIQTDDNDVDDNNGETVSTPSTVSTDCSSLCEHLLECAPNGDVAVCRTNCAELTPNCRACVVNNECSEIESGTCDVICGSLADPPPRPEASEGASCKPLYYASGTVGNGTKQLRTGNACLLPGECLSERCVSAQIGETEHKSWCGNKGSCKNPQNDDERCPSGWKCMEVSNFPDKGDTRDLCVPPDVDACTLDQMKNADQLDL